MTADGSVVILIEGDDSDLKGKLNSIGGIASGAAKAAAAAIAGISTALAGAAAHAVKVGAEFEASMSNVAAISGATGTELEQLSEKAKEMGAKTRFSASESAEAFTYMAMAGWETEDMLSGIEGIMSLAAASGESLASTSDIVTDALTAFGLSAKDSGHFADVLATASNSANTNVAMLGESFKYVAPVAGALGYSAEDTAVALGLMANSGIKASQAGTALRTILTNMSKPTDDMEYAMELLGVSLEDSEGGMRSLGEVMDQLRVGFGGGTMSTEEFAEKLAELDKGLESGYYTQESYAVHLEELAVAMYGVEGAQKAELAAMLAGKEGMSGLLAIVNASEEDYQKLTDSIYDASGAAEKMAEIQLDNLSGQLDILKSAVEGFEIEFFQSVGNPITETVTAAADAVSQLTETFRSEGLGAAIQELGGMAASAATALASAAPSFIETATGLVQSFLSGLRENLPEIAASALEIVGSLASGIVETLPELAQTGTEIVLQLAQSVIDGLPGMVPAAVQTIASLVEQITGNLSQIIEAGIQVVVALGEGLIEALPDLIEKVPEIVSNIANVINDNAPKMLAAAAKLVVELGVGLIQSIPTLIANIPKIIQAIVDAWSAFNWLDLGMTAITAIKDGILKIIPQVKTAGKNVLDAVVNAIKSLPQTLTNLGKTSITGLANAIRGLVGTAANAMSGVVSGILNAIAGLPGKMLDIGKNIVQGIANGIKNGAAAAINAVADLAGSVVDKAKGFLGIKSPSRVMAKEVGPYIPQGLAVGVEREIPRVERSMAAQLAGLTDRVRRAVEAETANISVGLTAKGGGGNPHEPAPASGGTVVNVYLESAPEGAEKARNMGRELGAEAAREIRRRGGVPA